MEEKALKIMAYFGLLFVIVWVVASALGKRSQLTQASPQPKPAAPGLI